VLMYYTLGGNSFLYLLGIEANLDHSATRIRVSREISNEMDSGGRKQACWPNLRTPVVHAGSSSAISPPPAIRNATRGICLDGPQWSRLPAGNQCLHGLSVGRITQRLTEGFAGCAGGTMGYLAKWRIQRYLGRYRIDVLSRRFCTRTELRPLERRLPHCVTRKISHPP
jgi:hypothetical protein